MRSYICEEETGLYYCQSRYYDPETGRFLNADAFASTGQGMLGNNMFAYCGNNPVNYEDSSGTYHRSLDSGIRSVSYEAPGTKGTALAMHYSELGTGVNIRSISFAYTDNKESLTINNSNAVITPLEQLGHSFYLNHFSEHRDYFVGSTMGMGYEWMLHNGGYYVFDTMDRISTFLGYENNSFSGLAQRCANVDLGPTIFHDSYEKHGFFSTVMKVSYIGFLWPTGAPAYDLIAYWLREDGL